MQIVYEGPREVLHSCSGGADLAARRNGNYEGPHYEGPHYEGPQRSFIVGRGGGRMWPRAKTETMKDLQRSFKFPPEVLHSCTGGG